MSMKHAVLVGVAFLLLTAGLFCIANAEEAKIPDFPYLSHMPNYDLHDSDDREFDEYSFFDGKGMVTIEGRKYAKTYSLKDGVTPASELQITRNYANAAKAAGGEVIYEGKCGEGCQDKSANRLATLKLLKGDKEIWVEVVPFNNGDNYHLTAIEKEEMKQDITKRDLLQEISSKGRAAIYVNFDVNKAVIRPESERIIDDVTQMMKANPELNLIIEGHTDNTGTPESNKTLSEERAKAVVNALVAKGIDAGRLASAGYGQEKPIADNSSEAGRAKNRRVELVKKAS